MISFSLMEIIHILAATIISAYILKDYFKLPVAKARRVDQMNEYYYNDIQSVSDRYGLKLMFYTFLLLIPSIGLHEIGHKVTANLLGFQSVIYADYTMLGIAFIVKMMSGIVFLAPAYALTVGNFMPLDNFLISFAGPLFNLILWLGSYYILKYANVSYKTQVTLGNLGRINKFLFFFNLLPIPAFDGWSVWGSLIRMIF